MTSKKPLIGILSTVFSSMSSASDDPDRVSLGEIESRLRSVAPTAQDRLDISNMNAFAPVVAGGAALLGAVYLLGHRRGKKRATILEVRRS